jgi:hypothetical protein
MYFILFVGQIIGRSGKEDKMKRGKHCGAIQSKGHNQTFDTLINNCIMIQKVYNDYEAPEG